MAHNAFIRKSYIFKKIGKTVAKSEAQLSRKYNNEI